MVELSAGSDQPILTCPAEPECSAEPVPPPDPSIEVHQGTRGFWCLKYADGEKAGRGECYRLESTCQIIRRRAIERGKRINQCVAADRAGCLEIIDYDNQKVYFRCFSPQDSCEQFRAKALPIYPHISECKLTL